MYSTLFDSIETNCKDFGLIIYVMEITEITMQSSSLVSSKKCHFGVIYSPLSLREIL